MPEPDFLAQQQARALHENVDADASAPDADGQQPDPLLGRRSVDKATLYGLVGSAVLLAVAVLFGGHSVAFVDLPAILIVILGTVTVTMSSFSMKDVRNTRAVLRNATHRTVWDIPDMVVFLLKLSEYARRFGVLKMQGALMDGVARQPFLHKGLEMAIDDMSYADVEAIMRAINGRLKLCAAPPRWHRRWGLLAHWWAWYRCYAIWMILRQLALVWLWLCSQHFMVPSWAPWCWHPWRIS
jgi:hypothetical protein